MTNQVTDPKAIFLGLMERTAVLVKDSLDAEALQRTGNFQKFHRRIESDLDQDTIKLEAEIRSFVEWIDSVTQKEAGEGFLGG